MSMKNSSLSTWKPDQIPMPQMPAMCDMYPLSRKELGSNLSQAWASPIGQSSQLSQPLCSSQDYRQQYSQSQPIAFSQERDHLYRGTLQRNTVNNKPGPSVQASGPLMPPTRTALYDKLGRYMDSSQSRLPEYRRSSQADNRRDSQNDIDAPVILQVLKIVNELKSHVQEVSQSSQNAIGDGRRAIEDAQTWMKEHRMGSEEVKTQQHCDLSPQSTSMLGEFIAKKIEETIERRIALALQQVAIDVKSSLHLECSSFFNDAKQRWGMSPSYHSEHPEDDQPNRLQGSPVRLPFLREVPSVEVNIEGSGFLKNPRTKRVARKAKKLSLSPEPCSPTIYDMVGTLAQNAKKKSKGNLTRNRKLSLTRDSLPEDVLAWFDDSISVFSSTAKAPVCYRVQRISIDQSIVKISLLRTKK